MNNGPDHKRTQSAATRLAKRLGLILEDQAGFDIRTTAEARVE